MSALSHVAIGLSIIAANIAVAYSGVAGPWWVHGIIGGIAGGWTGLNLSRAVPLGRPASPARSVAPRAVEGNELFDAISRRMSPPGYTWVDILLWVDWADKWITRAKAIRRFDANEIAQPCPKCGGNRASVVVRRSGGCDNHTCPLRQPLTKSMYMYHFDMGVRPMPLDTAYPLWSMGVHHPEHLHHVCGCGWERFSLCADHEEAS